LREANEGDGSFSFFPSLLSPLVSEATILPHHKIPVTGSAQVYAYQHLAAYAYGVTL